MRKTKFRGKKQSEIHWCFFFLLDVIILINIIVGFREGE
jgi:hypothetical protein